MLIDQLLWTEKDGWDELDAQGASNAQLLLVFGSRKSLALSDELASLKAQYPEAKIISATTAGEIIDVEVHDDSLAATAIHFEKTPIKFAHTLIADKSSRVAAEELAKQLPVEELSHVLVISDGLKVNGTKLIEGLSAILPENVSITGGLAGDGADFKQTLVGFDGEPQEGQLVAVGFYGKDLKIGYGSVGGWDPFGPDRRVTKSEANVLYELDGKPALELYKSYLGDKASELPSSALLFPLSMRTHLTDEDQVVRTILSVDEEKQSMTFAGDIAEGNIVRLMKANFDRLVDGAYSAAGNSKERIGSFEPELGLLISCVGRKLVLGQRIEDEVESVREVVGDSAKLTGFYSYGEIAPGNNRFQCRLHNQTMTITLFSEN